MACSNKTKIAYRVIATQGGSLPELQIKFRPDLEPHTIQDKFIALFEGEKKVERLHFEKTCPSELKIIIDGSKIKEKHVCDHSENFLSKKYIEANVPMTLKYCFDCGFMEQEHVYGDLKNWNQTILIIQGKQKRIQF